MPPELWWETRPSQWRLAGHMLCTQESFQEGYLSYPHPKHGRPPVGYRFQEEGMVRPLVQHHAILKIPDKGAGKGGPDFTPRWAWGVPPKAGVLPHVGQTGGPPKVGSSICGVGGGESSSQQRWPPPALTASRHSQAAWLSSSGPEPPSAEPNASRSRSPLPRPPPPPSRAPNQRGSPNQSSVPIGARRPIIGARGQVIGARRPTQPLPEEPMLEPMSQPQRLSDDELSESAWSDSALRSGLRQILSEAAFEDDREESYSPTVIVEPRSAVYEDA